MTESAPAVAGGAPVHGTGAPSAWVMRGLRWLPRSARVLDLASGHGRHARAAQSLGMVVTAADRDASALAAVGGGVRCVQADLEAEPLPFEAGSFDAVMVTNYLYRPRFSEICDLLAPGGLLIYETFALGNERYGRPSNPDFLLQPGELFERCVSAGLRVVAFEDGVSVSGRKARIQRVLAAERSADLESFAIEW
jgi:SAM-dependent methyltransferase